MLALTAVLSIRVATLHVAPVAWSVAEGATANTNVYVDVNTYRTSARNVALAMDVDRVQGHPVTATAVAENELLGQSLLHLLQSY